MFFRFFLFYNFPYGCMFCILLFNSVINGFFFLCLCILIVMFDLFSIFCFHLSNWQSSATLTGFSVLFPQLYGKSQGVPRKDRARSALFLISESSFLCIVIVDLLFYVLFVCKCVLYYCQRMSTQLQLNISYHVLDAAW
jgi:hypothetical protein